ncbi:MAG: hypothetical protein H0S77_01510 [Spirochaetaceae bacterium]|nr:hypothetical protein [Spirochaetaceae bacterium]
MNMHTRHAHLFTNETQRGILCIENLQDGTMHLMTSENLAKDIQSTRFLLDLGTFEHKDLQDAYERIGLEAFSIKVLVTAKDEENLATLLAVQEKRLMAQGKSLY